VNRRFDVEGPDQLWVSDVTEHPVELETLDSGGRDLGQLHRGSQLLRTALDDLSLEILE